MFEDTKVTCIAEAVSSNSSTFASTSEKTFFLTYEASSFHNLQTRMNSSSIKTYLEQQMKLSAGVLSLTTPIIIVPPEEPLKYEPLYQSCKNSTKKDDAALINNEKTKQYVFHAKARKPKEMSRAEWEHYFKRCTNRETKIIEAVIITDEVSRYMPILFIILAVLGIFHCGYNKVFGVKLDKNDPDLVRRKELKKELITAQEDLEVAITVGDRAAEKVADRQIKAIRKEQKLVDKSIKKKLKNLMDAAIAKADAQRAAKAREKKEKEDLKRKQKQEEEKRKREEENKKRREQGLPEKEVEMQHVNKMSTKEKLKNAKEIKDGVQDTMDTLGIDASAENFRVNGSVEEGINVEGVDIDTEQTMKGGAKLALQSFDKHGEKIIGEKNMKEFRKLRKKQTHALKIVSQCLLIISAVLSLSSAILLIDNYATGRLQILDLHVRLNGYKLSNGENITVIPDPFDCETCKFTFTPSYDVFKSLEILFHRNCA